MLLSVLIKRERKDYNVTIVERNDRVGKKLLATGNGRCNYTNVDVRDIHFHSKNEEFPMKIINKLDNEKTIELLKSIGIYPISESDGRVFPLSLQGSSVLDLLRIAMDKYDVKRILGEKIDSVAKVGDKFILQGSKQYFADKVVVATGGMALPASGSDGIGYRIGKTFGHNIIDQYPTIVQLKSDYKKIKSLKGVRIDTKATLYVDNKKISSKFGDVLFTDYGLSGPAILDLSRLAIENLNKNKKVEIGINLIGIPKKDIQKMIKDRMENLSGISAGEFFIGILNKKLIQSILDVLQLDYQENIDDANEQNVSEVLSDFRLNITGSKGFKDAQATTGGIDTKELKEESLESKLVDGLYFIGEVVDVDGDCGGYNLQWAWSSAFVASRDLIK